MAPLDRTTQVTLRPMDCSGACHEREVGCLCSGVWRTVDVLIGSDGQILGAKPLASSAAVQAAVESLAGGAGPEPQDANSLSPNGEAT